MEKQFSVKETSEVLVLLFAAAKAVKLAKADDGKINLLDAPQFMAVLPKVAPAIEGSGLVIKELSELDAQEADELAALVQAGVADIFDKAKLLEQIAAGLQMLKAIHAFVKLV